jgi:hypothetical protein
MFMNDTVYRFSYLLYGILVILMYTQYFFEVSFILSIFRMMSTVMITDFVHMWNILWQQSRLIISIPLLP